jgi:hypothetical protein
METIEVSSLIQANAWIILWYAVCATLAIIVMTHSRLKSRKKYATWKTDRLNLFIFERTWERSDDELVQQLFDENQRLASENKLLKQEKSNLETRVFIVLLVFLIVNYVQSFWKKKVSTHQ